MVRWQSVWPDWAIYWTLGNFSKPLATIVTPYVTLLQPHYVTLLYLHYVTYYTYITSHFSPNVTLLYLHYVTFLHHTSHYYTYITSHCHTLLQNALHFIKLQCTLLRQADKVGFLSVICILNQVGVIKCELARSRRCCCCCSFSQSSFLFQKETHFPNRFFI